MYSITKINTNKRIESSVCSSCNYTFTREYCNKKKFHAILCIKLYFKSKPASTKTMNKQKYGHLYHR